MNLVYAFYVSACMYLDCLTMTFNAGIPYRPGQVTTLSCFYLLVLSPS